MMMIDGAYGEGGGQILRTSLALSMCLNKPIEIMNIRANRPKPGLRPQHLTCVRAAKDICDADIQGDEVGSSCISFIPKTIKPGRYRFAIGTAGSTTLVLQTILPALLQADAGSTVFFEGGTHNPKAPSYDFINQVYFPALRKMGVSVESTIDRYGFVPKGGGQWAVSLEPVEQWRPTNITQFQSKARLDVNVLLANLEHHIADRELKVVQRLLPYKVGQVDIINVNAFSSGNMISIKHKHKDCVELIEVLGEKRLSAEKVARRVVDQYRHYAEAGVPVGEYLADQLLLPMALGAGGRFITAKPSLHTKTNIDVIEQITGKTFKIKPINKGNVEISL